MAEIFLLVVLGISLGVLFWQASLLISAIFGAPTVHTQKSAIIKAYKLADLKKGEVVLDLGCSDAGTLIYGAKEFGAKGIGIEISPFYFIKAKLNVALSRQKKQIKIIFGDFKKHSGLFRRADVIYLYLFPKILKEIEEELFSQLRPKARIVTIGFQFANHRANSKTSIVNCNRKSFAYLYKI